MASRPALRAAAPLMLRCWGGFSLLDPVTGAEMRPRGRRARALVAYLAMHAGRPVSRERLTALLWGDRAQEQARASLRQSLFELRELARSDPPLLLVERDSVMLNDGVLDTDIEELRVLAALGDGAGLLARLPEPDEALFTDLDGLSAGFDEWLTIERTRQRDALASVVATAIEKALANGDVRQARTLHARLAELDPAHPAPAPVAAMVPEEPAAPLAPPRPARTIRSAMAAALLLAAGIAGAISLGSTEVPVSAAAAGQEAEALRDVAHTIIYQRNYVQFPAAVSLLRRALTLAPDHAPTLASLAEVLAMSSHAPADRAEAEELARRAMRLAPDLGLAHGVLGMVLDFRGAEARAAIKRAATLDPDNPEVQFWLSTVLASEGDFPGQLKALRRAVAIDPHWNRALESAALAAWSLGRTEEAAGYMAQLGSIDGRRFLQCSDTIAWVRGDYAEVARNALDNRARPAAGAASWDLGMALLVLGHEQPARLLTRLPPPLWRIATGAGPASSDLEPLLIDAPKVGDADFFLTAALRQLLRSGRAADIAAAFDGRIGILQDIRSGNADPVLLTREGVQVALALRAVGRSREGDALLARADGAIRRSLAHGEMPNWMHAAAAEVWAAQGRREDALQALEQAIARGWHPAPATPMPDLADVPAFGSLRGDPRFEALRHREQAHLEQERRKLDQLLRQAGQSAKLAGMTI